MRRAARKDANHTEIVEAFRRLGIATIDVSACPCGFDLIAGFQLAAIAVEVKDGRKAPSARRLTPNEEKRHAAWTGPKTIVQSVDDAAWVASELRSRSVAIFAMQTPKAKR